MGKANAAVFPEPVFAPPMTSLFARMEGMQAFWISLGLRIESDASASTSQLLKPRSSNEVSFDFARTNAASEELLLPSFSNIFTGFLESTSAVMVPVRMS